MVRQNVMMLFVGMFFLSSVNAQDIQWENNLGGSRIDEAEAVVQTADGGFAICGFSESSDGDLDGNKGIEDVWIVKLNGDGTIQWQNNIGGSSSERGNAIIQTSDGGLAVAGHTRSADGDVSSSPGATDYWIVKLDDNGTIQWEKTFGGSGSDKAFDMVQTSDNGYAVAGRSGSSDGDVGGNNGSDDFWVIKLDNNGALQWENNMGGSDIDKAEAIIQTSDEELVVAGQASSSDGDVGGNNGLSDFWIVKLDGTGAIQWENNFGGFYSDYAYSIAETSEGALLIAGSSNSDGDDVGGNYGGTDAWVTKLNGNGNLQWEQNYGGSSSDGAYSLVKTSGDGFALAGYSESVDNDVNENNGEKDYWIMRMDEDGTLIWENNLGGSGTDVARSMVQTSDGGYGIVGHSNSSDQDVSGNNGEKDFLAVKLNDSTLNSSSVLNPDNKLEVKVFPNPTKGELNLKREGHQKQLDITIRDIEGRIVQRKSVNHLNSFQMTLNAKPGLYFVELQNPSGERKVVKVLKE